MRDQSQEAQDMFAELIAGSPGLRKLFEPDKATERKKPKTRLFPADKMNYRYTNAGTTDEGIRVRCCWSCWKNVAGYYLAWVERWGVKQGSRSQYTAHKTRKAARACALRWANDRKR